MGLHGFSGANSARMGCRADLRGLVRRKWNSLIFVLDCFCMFVIEKSVSGDGDI